MSDAEELVLGARPNTPDRPEELVLVARGVRGDINPAALVDDDGQPLWSPGPAGNVRELVRDHDAHGHTVGASLFELPGRTWVIAQGSARGRAREAFAHPFGRPTIDLDPQALAVVRLDGPSLVKRFHALQELGALAAVGGHLQSVTLALPPGAEHTVTAKLAYAEDDFAAAADVTVREAIGAVSRSGRPGLAWLASAESTTSRRPSSSPPPSPASSWALCFRRLRSARPRRPGACPLAREALAPLIVLCIGRRPCQTRER